MQYSVIFCILQIEQLLSDDYEETVFSFDFGMVAVCRFRL